MSMAAAGRGPGACVDSVEVEEATLTLSSHSELTLGFDLVYVSRSPFVAVLALELKLDGNGQ